MNAEIRKDYLRNQYVIITSGGGQRAQDAPRSANLSVSCSLCPTELSGADPLYRFPEHGQWHIGVLPSTHHATLLDRAHQYEAQETLVEVPEHGLHLEDLPQEHIARIFEAYAARVHALTAEKKIQHFMIFKNAGGPASGMHAYSQLYGSVALPAHLEREREFIQQYRKTSGRCVFCDVVKEERTSGRLIYEDDFITVFTPYASTKRYEAWIMPQRHLDGVGAFSGDERHAIAGIIKKLFHKIAQLHLPSHFSLHQTMNDPDQHVYLVVAPRDYRAVSANFGLIVNPVSPEFAAQYYRQ